ncbi:MAG: AI-2E family transporter [Schleiferiaceae bacterium]|jgi:predicted PurR-regulated permease PerM|nr:AI-2E family transporter [Schleiferiaceae bacterium]
MTDQDGKRIEHPIDVVIRISALVVIIAWSFQILKPFLSILVWSLIISIALFPVQKKLSELLNNRNKLAAMLITLGMLILIILPITILAEELIKNFSTITQTLSAQNIDVPPPSDRIKEIAIIGETVWENWHEANENLEEFILDHSKELEKIGLFLFGSVAVAGKGLFMFIAAVIVSGLLLIYSSRGRKFADGLSVKLAGKRGHEIVHLAETTTRSVVTGVLGVAIIQSSLAGIGFMLAEIPYWGILVMIVLFLALIQVGVFPVVVPAVIYMFATADTTTAVIFLIWNLLVLVSDNVLKPILLGRGTKVPTLIVFLGAIGGFIQSGFLGLFIGPVVLSIAHELLTKWLRTREQEVIDEQVQSSNSESS